MSRWIDRRCMFISRLAQRQYGCTEKQHDVNIVNLDESYDFHMIFIIWMHGFFQQIGSHWAEHFGTGVKRPLYQDFFGSHMGKSQPAMVTLFNSV